MEGNFKEHERLHGPDVLRGFAAAGVVLYHVYYLSGIPEHPLAAALVGRFDFLVRLFFALSGFAIAYAYSEKLTSLDHLRDFYLKRFLRLGPLFYFMIALRMVQVGLHYQPRPSNYDYLLAFAFLFPFVPGKHASLVAGGWSLGLEWLFYLCFPCLISLLRNLGSALLAWSLFCVLAVAGRTFFREQGTPPALVDYGILFFLSHLPFFLSGIACFHLCRRLGTNRLARHSGLLGVGMLLGIGLTMAYFYLQLDQRIPEELFLSVASFVLILGSTQGLPVWLDNAATRYLGKISYSIYLMQFPIIQVFHDAGIYARLASPTLPFISCAVAGLLTLLVVFGVSSLTFRFIEAPGMRAFKRFGVQNEKRRGALEPAFPTPSPNQGAVGGGGNPTRARIPRSTSS